MSDTAPASDRPSPRGGGPAAPASLAAALVQLQSELTAITRGETAEVPTKAGGKYTYRYADYAAIIEEIRPLLTRNGFAWTCKPTLEDGEFGLRYRLLHAPSGEEDSGFYPIPQNMPAQARGSEITYARRYCLTAVLDIALDDDDGKAATDAWQPPAHPHSRKADRHHAARNGPLPDDEWTDAAPDETPGSITASRATELGYWFTKAGITSSKDRLSYAQARLDRPELTESAQLSEADGVKLAALLKKEGR